MSQYTQRVNTGMNDAYKVIGGSWWNALNVIGVGNNVEGFVRFTSVGINSGATIDSAYLTIITDPTSYSNGNMYLKIKGIDEDNTADFTNDASGRGRTTAAVDWDIASPWGLAETYVSPDIKSIIQEIINRDGWAANNAIGLVIENDGSSINNEFQSYEKSLSYCAYLEINYTGISTRTKKVEVTARIINPERDYGIVISKPTYEIDDTNPSHLIFSSDYGTLKYFTTGSVSITIDNSLGEDIAGSVSYEHNLGYYPYVEVYCQRPGYTDYEYCPTFGGGASTTWKITYKITTTYIVFYAEVSGFNTSVTIYFKFFLFKNNLGL